MLKLEDYFAALKVVEDDVVVVNIEDEDRDEDIELPQALRNEVKELDFDIIECLAAILQAWQ